MYQRQSPQHFRHEQYCISNSPKPGAPCVDCTGIYTLNPASAPYKTPSPPAAVRCGNRCYLKKRSAGNMDVTNTVALQKHGCSFIESASTGCPPLLCLLHLVCIRDGSRSWCRFEFHQLLLSLVSMTSLFIFYNVYIRSWQTGDTKIVFAAAGKRKWSGNIFFKVSYLW